VTTIILIRHAEKPDGEFQGVNEIGANDPDSLIPRGWQRAGALAVFLAAKSDLPIPDRIYVSAPDKEKVAPHIKIGSKSNRPLETLAPLASKLNMVPIQTFAKGEEADLVDAIVRFDGTTLVCWQHEAIPQIAGLIMGSNAGIPDPWPGDRIDVLWTFTRSDIGNAWTFGQMCQRLLTGDGPDPIT
jgi:hypothetical protein